MNMAILTEGPLKIAKARLLSRYPLFGGLVATWRCIPDASAGTVAIGLTDNGFDLLYNPEFISSLPMDQLVGILHHEARHVVYEHVFMRPEEYPDGEALMIAQEVTANENLPERLPKGAIRLRHYPMLRPNTSTEERYRKLAQSIKNSNQGGSASVHLGEGESDRKSARQNDGRCDSKREEETESQEAAVSGQGESEPTDGTPSTPRTADPNRVGQHGPHGDGRKKVKARGAATGQSQKEKGGETSKGQSPAPKSIDEHTRWQTIQDQESMARWIVDGVVREVMAKEAQLTEREHTAINEMCRQRGIDPGSYISQLATSKEGQRIAWISLLRRYIGRELQSHPTYARPPRRFPQLLGMVPGKIRRADRPRILAVIDTSESMRDEILSEISRELTYMTHGNEVIVAECDTEIHRVYRYTKPIKEVHGRGGTDFRPVLESSFLAKQKIDVVILFTDGDGDTPESAPRIPVVWAITDGGEPPVSWGRVVRIKNT